MAKKIIITIFFGFFFMCAIDARAGLKDGLILHYSFDQDDGATVADESGNNHTGSVMGAAYTEDGRFHGACSFDGVDDYILAGNLGYHEIGAISFWMNAAAVENWRNPFSTDYAGWDDNIRFEESSTGEFSGGGHGLGRGDIFTRAMEPNRWYHVAYVWDENYVYGYLDGEFKFKNHHPDPSSKVHPDLPLTAGEYKQSTLNFTNVAIGNGYSSASERFWKGLIDEVRIYDRPLNASEVKLLYQGRADGLVLHYTFDTNNNGTVIDQSGMGNNAAVAGAVYTTAGRIGGAYQFDGIDDQILAQESASLRLGDELTLAAWFYITDTQERPIIEWADVLERGVHMSTNANGTQWGGKGTGVNLVDTSGNQVNYVISTDNPSINQWHHLAVAYSKVTGKAQLYLDGLPVAEKVLGAFTPQTGLPLYVGRSPSGSGKSFRGFLDDIRVYNKALKPYEVRAMFDAFTHGKVYQNFEANNGSGAEYGWPINTQYGVSTARTTERKHAGSYSWKLSVPSGTPEWSGATGIKSQRDAWHVNAESARHDRLAFWVYGSPVSNQPYTVRVKFFDHSQYVSGYTIQTQEQAGIGVWTKLNILFTQLPQDFKFSDIDKIEFYVQGSGTYYLDDIEITSADRIYQAFEKRPGVSTSDSNEYGWVWNGVVSLSTDKPIEGLQSWNLTAMNTLPDFAGTGIKFQGKSFDNSGNPNDIWNVNLVPSSFSPKLYNQLTFFLKQSSDKGLANDVEVGLFDHGNFTSGHKVWSIRRSDDGEWAKITVPFDDFPESFNFSDVNKIEMAVYWPGEYNFDDIRVAKYPELRINEEWLSSGIVSWDEHPGAARYVLERSTQSAQGPWSTVYSGTQNIYLTDSLLPLWFRLRWETDANTTRGTVAYVSDWSEPARYETKQPLIEKDKLQKGYVEWTFIPQASLYELQQGNSKFGPWTLIYQGAYQVPPPVAATVGRWYRVRAIQKNSAGAVTSRGQWSPALLYDPAAFVSAQGTALRDKKSSGRFLKLSGINLGNYLLIEPWMFFGSGSEQAEEFPDDWTIRQTLRNRPDIGEDGLSELLNQYRRAYIQESDLDNFMRLGINFIRLPLYIEDIRPVDDNGQWKNGQFDFSAIDRIVRLCGDRGIYVLLDLHGAPGCQSKEYHTGRKDFNRLFAPSNDNFRQRTVELWKAIAERYKDNTTVLGYDLLNEPFGAITQEYYSEPQAGYAALWSLYDRMYDAIRNASSLNGAGDTNHLIVMESIPSERDWETLPKPSTYGWSNVAYQFHYYGFTFDENGKVNGTKTYEEHQAYLNDKIQNSRQSAYNVPVLIGEFNGFGEARIWELLMDTFNGQGWNWSPWSYKIHDAASEWGLYTHANYNEDAPDPQNDSEEALSRKMSKYATAQYHRAHNSLINSIRSKAKLPGYIHNLKATKGNQSVTLTWSAPYSVSSITQYRVRYGTVNSGGFSQVFIDNATPGATITGLTNGVNYQFRVEAVSADGTGPLSNTVTATPSV